MVVHLRRRGHRLNTVLDTAAAAFSPDDIAGLKLWLKADDGPDDPVDGQPVTTWSDQSGNSNDVTQATAGKKPTYKTSIQNGLPTVRFDGTDDNMKGSPNIAVDGITCFFCVDAKRTNTYQYYAQADSIFTLGQATIGFWDGSWQQIGSATSGNQILRWVFDSATTGTLYRNGASLGTGTYSGTRDMDIVTIGSDRNNGGDAVEADMYEVLMYETELSAEDQSSVESYLNDRWAIY